MPFQLKNVDSVEIVLFEDHQAQLRRRDYFDVGRPNRALTQECSYPLRHHEYSDNMTRRHVHPTKRYFGTSLEYVPPYCKLSGSPFLSEKKASWAFCCLVVLDKL